MPRDDDPTDAELLTGFDLDALEATVTEIVTKAETTGEPPDWAAIAVALGVDEDWVEAEYGPGFEVEITIDPEFEAKLLADCGLDKLNARGGSA